MSYQLELFDKARIVDFNRPYSALVPVITDTRLNLNYSKLEFQILNFSPSLSIKAQL